MTPPLKLDPLCDTHGGFTIETRGKRMGVSTLWRPYAVLKDRVPAAILDSYNEQDFYQDNNNVTKARYHIQSYRYPVIAWFDNATGERIA